MSTKRSGESSWTYTGEVTIHTILTGSTIQTGIVEGTATPSC